MNAIDTQARETLARRRKAIQRLFNLNEEEVTRLQLEVEPDWPDRAVVQESATVLERLTEAERRELGEIDAALERIRQGTFGRCERCGGAIGRQRLRAIPEGRHCLTCSDALARAP